MPNPHTFTGDPVIAQRYLVYNKDLQKDGNTLLIPFYMIPFI